MLPVDANGCRRHSYPAPLNIELSCSAVGTCHNSVLGPLLRSKKDIYADSSNDMLCSIALNRCTSAQEQRLRNAPSSPGPSKNK